MFTEPIDIVDESDNQIMADSNKLIRLLYIGADHLKHTENIFIALDVLPSHLLSDEFVGHEDAGEVDGDVMPVCEEFSVHVDCFDEISGGGEGHFVYL